MISDIKLQGLDSLSRTVSRVARAEQMLARAVLSEANTVLNESKKIVPVDTGVLKNSGAVSDPTIRRGSVEVEVSYGGAAAPYAIYVHEDPEATHAPGKTYKYLEIPFMAHKDKFVRNVKVKFLAWMKMGV